MDTNVLERVRALEADIERSIDSIVQQDLFAASITNERHRILLDHFTLQQVDMVKATAEKLLDAYLDEDDIVVVQEAPAETADDIAAAVKAFEAKIADIREYHHHYHDLPPVRHDLSTPDPKLLEEVFTLNERYGACLDIDSHYARYSAFMVHTKTVAESCEGNDVSANLLAELAPVTPASVQQWSSMWPGRLDFFRFTKALPDILLSETEAHRKLVAFGLYKAFVTNLLAYLVDFHHRVHPLQTQTLDRLLAEVEGDGEEYWAALTAAKAEVTSAAAAVSTVAGDEDNDGDAAAVEDEASEPRHPRRGTVRVAVENKVSCGLVIPPSLRRHAKKFSLWPLTMLENVISDTRRGSAADAPEEVGKTGYPSSLGEVKEVCMAEAKAAALLHSLLFTVLENTDRTLLRDYSRTMEELESDRAATEEEFRASLAEVRRNSAATMEGTVANAARYNHHLASRDGRGGGRYGRGGRGGGNGVDGHAASTAASTTAAASATKVKEDEEEVEKEELLGENGEPIPRWLAQLHQLDKVFRCDVCGGTVYKGPKVFREHFGADRHAEGLRRLGVTQRLKSFEGITSIREVVELRDKLNASESGFRKRLRENMEHEEIQDGRGRVLSGKAYERRQNSRRDGR